MKAGHGFLYRSGSHRNIAVQAAVRKIMSVWKQHPHVTLPSGRNNVDLETQQKVRTALGIGRTAKSVVRRVRCTRYEFEDVTAELTSPAWFHVNPTTLSGKEEDSWFHVFDIDSDHVLAQVLHVEHDAWRFEAMWVGQGNFKQEKMCRVGAAASPRNNSTRGCWNRQYAWRQVR